MPSSTLLSVRLAIGARRIVSLGASTICPRLPERVSKTPKPISRSVSAPALSNQVRNRVPAVRSGTVATFKDVATGFPPDCDALAGSLRLDPEALVGSAVLRTLSPLIERNAGGFGVSAAVDPVSEIAASKRGWYVTAATGACSSVCVVEAGSTTVGSVSGLAGKVASAGVGASCAAAAAAGPDAATL